MSKAHNAKPPEEKMLTTATNLRREQHEALKALSAATKVPMSEFIREAVDAFLAARAPAPSSPAPGKERP